MKTIPWYKSGIVRQSVVQLVLALLAGMGVTLNAVDMDSIVGLVMAGASALTAIRTVLTRMHKPTPPITETAVDATVEFNRSAP
jgi:ABC-type amino acid transport system permease subunit